MGKRARRRQRAAMNRMNQQAQDQFGYFKEQQGIAQAQVDETRADYEAFQFTNPFADAQNAFGGIQTQFGNIYAGTQNVYADAQNQYAGMQNLYEGMENRFEDMTVDMRAADFQAQQGQQQRANIMQGLRGAAGTSGIAGLAQSLANQGALQSQQISAGISQQERQNQMLAAQEGARIDQLQRGAGMQLQQMEAQGAMQVQQMQMAGASEQQKMILAGQAQAQQLGVSQINQQAKGQWAAEMARMEGAAGLQAAEFGQQATLLGMDYGLLAGANQGLQQAMANQMSGTGMQANMYGSQASSTMGTIGSLALAAASIFSDKRLKKNINLIGKSSSGLNIYSFEYIDSKYGEGLFQGVMSDEIPQEAVSNINGYDRVNYSMLDVEFKQI